jgi:hypothetical protein
MRPPTTLLGGLLQCGALVSAGLAPTPPAHAQRGRAISGVGYSHSASPCGAASITDDTTCADVAGVLGCTLRFRGPGWASGCLLIREANVYFSPGADAALDRSPRPCRVRPSTRPTGCASGVAGCGQYI